MFAEPRSVIFSLVTQPSNAPPRRSQQLNGSALACRTWSRRLLRPGQSPWPTRPQGSVGSPGRRCLTQPRCPRNQRSGLQKVSPVLWRDRSNRVGQMSKVNMTRLTKCRGNIGTEYLNFVYRLLFTAKLHISFFELAIWHASLVKVTLLRPMNLILGHFRWGLL